MSHAIFATDTKTKTIECLFIGLKDECADALRDTIVCRYFNPKFKGKNKFIGERFCEDFDLVEVVEINKATAGQIGALIDYAPDLLLTGKLPHVTTEQTETKNVLKHIFCDRYFSDRQDKETRYSGYGKVFKSYDEAKKYAEEQQAIIANGEIPIKYFYIIVGEAGSYEGKASGFSDFINLKECEKFDTEE